LSRTFSLAAFSNGVVAILAGMVASGVTVIWGFVSPFMVSLLFLVLSSIFIARNWKENYGNSEMQLSKVFYGSVSVLMNDRKVALLGVVQSLFEASMYIFVFLWTPMLEPYFSETEKTGEFGLHGVIFASFMVCIMIGSSSYRLLERHFSVETIYATTLFISSVLFFGISSIHQQYFTFFGFMAFEVCCGIHFVCIGTLRGRYIPEESRAGVMNLFRVPLNVLVVAVLVWIERFSNEKIMLMCASWLAIAAFCQFILAKLSAKPVEDQEMQEVMDGTEQIRKQDQ